MLTSQLVGMKPPISWPSVSQAGGLKYVRRIATGWDANMIAKKIAGQIMVRLMSFLIRSRMASGMRQPNARNAPMNSPFVMKAF